MPGPNKIMLIRHAEKPEVPPPIGVQEDGTSDKHSLTVRGWQRSGALTVYFDRPYVEGIERPRAIYASGTTQDATVVGADDAKSLRPQETITPLSRRLGLEPQTSIPVGNESALIDALRSETGVVLVAWEHKRIPLIAAGFVENPPQWGDRFDTVWILDKGDNETYQLRIINQDLLDGDAPTA